ncbi:coiled-coil domain-containing protein 97-like isoform X2 [Branchiostoma lanceolatum]|uniref:coiled-coil domain-containing protein 97-like isoform X2 n=1 Tax=Branchiostoma lanceolatum TaxID=7740 RepID=UPI001132A44A
MCARSKQGGRITVTCKTHESTSALRKVNRGHHVSKVSVFNMAAAGELGRDADMEVGPLEAQGATAGSSACLPSGVDPLVEHMIRRIADSEARIKNQSRDEPDLTTEQKMDIVRGILEKSHLTFLERFWKYLAEEDLEYFQRMQNCYELDFYMKEIRKRLDNAKKKTGVKNRRYEAMQRMLQDGSYFSEEEMRQRDPLLYEQNIGQFLDPEEKNERSADPDMSLSQLIMGQIEEKIIESKLAWQMEREDDMFEEEEDSDEEEEDQEENAGDAGEKVPSAAEQAILKAEFLHTMQERFLQGDDEEFDYSTVDDNADYDNVVLRGQDEEERYFDDEDPCDVEDMDEDDGACLVTSESKSMDQGTVKGQGKDSSLENTVSHETGDMDER